LGGIHAPLDFGLNSCVRTRVVTVHEFRAILRPQRGRYAFDDGTRRLNPLFDPVEDLGFTHFSWQPDLAHVALKGCGAHALGAAIESVVAEPGQVPGASIGARIDQFNEWLNRAYDEQNVPVGERLDYLSKSVFRKRGDYPEVNAKFAKVKNLFGPCYEGASRKHIGIGMSIGVVVAVARLAA